MALFDRGGAGDSAADYDPLFYRGKSPVLGAPVELRTSGELPGQFPSAGPAPPSAPTAPAPGAPPRAPGALPEFPGFSFDFGGMDFPTPPDFPGGAPSGLFGPGGSPTPWWMSAAALGEKGVGLGRQLAQSGPPGELPPWTFPGAFTLQGFTGVGEPGFSLTGAADQPVLDYPNFRLLSDATISPGVDAAGQPLAAGGGGPGLSGLLSQAAPFLQTAGGIAAMAMNKPNSPGFAAGGLNAAGGAGAAAAELGLIGQSGWALGPAGAALSAPLILGPYYSQMVRGLGGDKPDWPTGYQPLSMNDQMAVDPSTGAVLVYRGNGQYEWSDQTQQGQRATPEQFTQWGIDPTGDLLKMPGYLPARDALVSADVGRAGTLTGAEGGGGSPSIPTVAHQQAALETARQPAIAAIAQANPGASEGELWRQYTLTQQYQQEQDRQAQWGRYIHGE
jgi:hypothetical protein